MSIFEVEIYEEGEARDKFPELSERVDKIRKPGWEFRELYSHDGTVYEFYYVCPENEDRSQIIEYVVKEDKFYGDIGED